MTKTNQWIEVQKLLEDNKASKALKEALELLLAPKSGGSSANPPKVDKDGNITEAYCRYHERYEKVENMVMSQGKSKGYCKASISLWNKINSDIKKLNNLVSEAVGQGDIELAQKHSKEVTALKAKHNDVKTYDFDRDWKTFNEPKVVDAPAKETK